MLLHSRAAQICSRPMHRHFRQTKAQLYKWLQTRPTLLILVSVSITLGLIVLVTRWSRLPPREYVLHQHSPSLITSALYDQQSAHQLLSKYGDVDLIPTGNGFMLTADLLCEDVSHSCNISALPRFNSGACKRHSSSLANCAH
jgi:hypothetical protein